MEVFYHCNVITCRRMVVGGPSVEMRLNESFLLWLSLDLPCVLILSICQKWSLNFHDCQIFLDLRLSWHHYQKLWVIYLQNISTSWHLAVGPMGFCLLSASWSLLLRCWDTWTNSIMSWWMNQLVVPCLIWFECAFDQAF